MGNKKPTAALVVAPNIAMVSPMFLRVMERRKQMLVRINVTIMFCLDVNFCPGGRISCSTESLHGKRVRGVPKKIAVIIPSRDIRFWGAPSKG